MEKMVMEILQEKANPVSYNELANCMQTDMVTITRAVDALHKLGQVQLFYDAHEWHCYPASRPAWYTTELDKQMHGELKKRHSLTHHEAAIILHIREDAALESLERLSGQLRASHLALSYVFTGR